MAQALRPENGGGVEDKVLLRPRVNGRGPMLRTNSALKSCAAADDLQSGDLWGIAVVFPADEPRDCFAFLHPGPRKDPVVRVFTNPVAPAVYRIDVARPDEKSLVW